MRHLIPTLILTLTFGFVPALAPTVARAEGFYLLSSREAFLRVMQNRSLKQGWMHMRFDHLGQIKGRVWGRPLLGNWQWQDQQLCKRVFHGTIYQGEVCGTLRTDGSTVIFAPEKGEGERERFTLK